MSVEKEPLSNEELDRILARATTMSNDNNKYEPKKVVLFLRYTGMHIRILCEPKKYKLRVEDNDIVWSRTKKSGKEAHTRIRISKEIDFDVKDFVESLKNRRRKNNRQYFYRLVREIGERAGIKGLSPMSFRHTLGVDMLDRGFPEEFVRQTLNCSRKVLETYLRYSKKRSGDLFDKIGW